MGRTIERRRGKPGRPSPYRTLYDRLVANSRLQQEDNPQSCWVWQGTLDNYGYPIISLRRADKKPQGFRAHRLMLQLVTGYEFPHDEAGHLCSNPACISPLHLEIQTRAMNMHDSMVRAPGERGCWIPVLYPIEDALQIAADNAWDEIGLLPSEECPF